MESFSSTSRNTNSPCYKLAKQQLLVRFENVTHVIAIPSNADEEEAKQVVKGLLSDRTGWPAPMLRVRSWKLPHCDLTVVSSIRGGKGGFGTLLKGQSRQAGAKLTTDFGACRDLQGRRLRHVNDEIKLRKWRDMQSRKQLGEKVTDEELYGPTGLYNWHLMTPTWADISKKATHRIKRQFKLIDQQAQKAQAKRKEEEQALQESITHYLGTATRAAEEIRQSLPDAIKQGLEASKKRKQIETSPPPIVVDRTNSLCTLSGEAILLDQKVQSKSDFCTVVLILDSLPAENQVLYYEVTLVSGGLAQIGWACLVGDLTFEPNDDFGDGVGDDAASYAFDGSRILKFHSGKEEPYGKAWKAGDRLGCRFDVRSGKIAYSLNGIDLGTAFETKAKSLFPAFSCNQGEILELHSQLEHCKHIPEGAEAVAELLVSDDKEIENAHGSSEVENILRQHQVQHSTGGMRNAKLPGEVQETAVTRNDPVKAQPLDLESFNDVCELEALGLDRLKGALLALQVKCGYVMNIQLLTFDRYMPNFYYLDSSGSLSERAARLFSLKGLPRKEYPMKIRAKNFVV